MKKLTNNKTLLLALIAFTLLTAVTGIAQNVTTSTWGSSANYLPKYNNTSTTGPIISNSQLYDNGTNIVWGATAPIASELFSIQKTQSTPTQMRINNLNTGATAAVNYIATAYNSSIAMSAYGGGWTSGGIAQAGAGVISSSAAINVGTTGSSVLSFWTNNNQQMTISPTGSVGILNTSPAYPLDVNGHIHVPSGKFFYSGTTSGNYLSAGFDGVNSAVYSTGTPLLLNYNTTSTPDVKICTGAVGGYVVTGNNVEIGGAARNSNTALNLKANGSTAIAITNSGNANIFNIDASGNTTVAGNLTLPIHSATSGTYNNVLVDVNGNLVKGGVNSTSSVGWALGGNSGTYVGTYPTGVSQSIGATDANADLPIWAGGSEKIRLLASGDLCLSIPTPFPTTGKGNQIYLTGNGNTDNGLGYFANYTNDAGKVYGVLGPVLYSSYGGALATSFGHVMALSWDWAGRVHIGQQMVTSGPHADALLTVSGKV